MTFRDDNSQAQRAIKPNANRGWIAFAIAVAAIVAVFAVYRMSGDRNAMPVQSNSTTMPAITGSENTVSDGRTNPQNQPSPQGPTGPLNTTSDGAPAANPRGETPPGMQSGPGANK